MKKIKKSMLTAYSVLAIGIALMLVVGFSVVVSAQTDKEPTMLDQIMAMYLGLKSGEAPVVEQPVITPEPEVAVGSAQRPDLVITKLVDYDDITTSGVQIFATSTGSFYLENLVIETASSTIASGTAFQVYTLGETYGNAETVFSTQVSNFPKDTTMDLNTVISSSGTGSGYASSTQRVMLDDNSALYVKCTTASCKPSTNRLSESEANGTTYGFVRFTAILKRADLGSSIYE
jgi:hypothetical protein